MSELKVLLPKSYQETNVVLRISGSNSIPGWNGPTLANLVCRMPYRLGACGSEPPAKKLRPAPAAASIAATPCRKEDLACKPLSAPPADVLGGFDWTCGSWACISVVTNGKPKPSRKHDWDSGKRFGHLCLLDGHEGEEELRIVQISWAVGTFELGTDTGGRPKKYVTKLVRPSGFSIGSHVSENFGISQDRALAQGLPLNTVLEEMVKDVRYFLRATGGRICMHNLEYEARIVDAELRRAGVDHAFWAEAS